MNPCPRLTTISFRKPDQDPCLHRECRGGFFLPDGTIQDGKQGGGRTTWDVVRATTGCHRRTVSNCNQRMKDRKTGDVAHVHAMHLRCIGNECLGGAVLQFRITRLYILVETARSVEIVQLPDYEQVHVIRFLFRHPASRGGLLLSRSAIETMCRSTERRNL